MILDTLLVLPDFNKPFCIDSDSSNFQLGSIIYQDHGIIAHHSRSLAKHQQRCATPEKESLAIADALKTFRTAILGNDMTIKTDALILLGKKIFII